MTFDPNSTDPRLMEPWTPPPDLWRGETVVVLASGPSLSGPQIHHLALARLGGQCRVIAIKQTVYLAWWSDWVHWWHELTSQRGFLSGVAEPPRIKTYGAKYPIPDVVLQTSLPGWRPVWPRLDDVELVTCGGQAIALPRSRDRD